ncbi:MAG: LCP family protein [Clostridiaceae bacterium]|nr:LCP family protein [Clostridia bacterium]MBP6950039.1 LCP family protein [Clostridia bacterium]NMA36020.1 LCP family protein [Clostridiaceae bacterium]
MNTNVMRKKNLAVATAGFLVGIILAVMVFVFGYLYFVIGLRNYEDTGEIPIETNLGRLDVPDNMSAGMKIPVKNDKHVENILIIGSDTRDPDKHGRSDAMILVTINTKTRKIHLTSLSRAIYVSIPDDPDPQYKRYWSSKYMLNAAHTWGGPRLLMKTIQRNFRVDVSRYVATDFSGFKGAIDEVGGVSINLTAAEAKYLNRRSGKSLKAGTQLLDGETALSYARIRKLDSDFKRMERQRNVIMALFKKFAASNPKRMASTAEALMPYVTTNLTDMEFMGLIVDFVSYRNYDIDQLMLPLEKYGALVIIRGMEMYDINWTKNIDTLHAFMES